ncbi:auxin-responsive protein SAUR71 [Selaginella moellendorffii]|uniref:auxin-responsive protein SAUR71 n=1 Tax=Selaginella moellendorffii TaxID=88036 RepID=UPI000D1D122C|nr:auxin-responsive protein SAUR71 [Selaginella moellendorffii]|eukprot:XP_024537740.1 auxin-responsive protein SAUR71 [Selaginella moellendorffii]
MDRVKQMVRRWQKFSCAGSFSSAPAMESEWRKGGGEGDAAALLPEGGALTVYVGRERRRYVLGDEYVNHPLFKSLLARKSAREALDRGSSPGNPPDFSSSAAALEQEMCIPCEVVLFEHLLWILSSDDAAEIRDSAEELVDFYAWA